MAAILFWFSQQSTSCLVIYNAANDAVSDKAVSECAKLTQSRLSFEVGNILINGFTNLLISCVENMLFPSDVFSRIVIGFRFAMMVFTLFSSPSLFV